LAKRRLTRGERNIAWIERYCRTPSGMHVGKPIVLRAWQRAEIKKIYDNPHGTRQAIISMPRKNGKTALIAFLLLLHLCGPEAKANSELYSAAQSRDQAATVFKLAAKVIRQSPDLSPVLIIRDTAKELLCPELGTFYAALSADKSTAHGKSPIFAVHDELGQVKGPTSELYDAVETGMGAHEQPLSVIISTQAPTDNDLLSRLIDKAKTGEDPQTTVTVFEAPMNADPFDIKTLKACNPAWGDFLNDKEVIRTMEGAKALTSQEPAYRNLHLNQRVDQSNPFVTRAVWDACGGRLHDWGQEPVWAGLDLSSTSDLTAFVPMAWIEDAWEVKPTFWLPNQGLREKARADRVEYDIWHNRGFLETTPGKAIEYEFVASWLYEFDRTHNVQKIAFDRWGMKFLRPWLVQAGFTDQRIEELFAEFGQGFQSMSPALRDTEAALLQRKVRHGEFELNGETKAGHPVLNMCAANAVVTMDPAGNRKLNKAKAAGRIDGMVALAMAFGVAPAEPVERAPEHKVFIF
jgi:phage terminase large subunit-like protein